MAKGEGDGFILSYDSWRLGAAVAQVLTCQRANVQTSYPDVHILDQMVVYIE